MEIINIIYKGSNSFYNIRVEFMTKCSRLPYLSLQKMLLTFMMIIKVKERESNLTPTIIILTHTSNFRIMFSGYIF